MEVKDNCVDIPTTDVHLPLSRVTIAAESKEAYDWINRSVFATGLLVANIQDKIILEKGVHFPVPSNVEVFKSDDGFTVDLFNQLLIIECDPVLKGVLSLHTEIVVIEQFVSDEDDITLIKEKAKNELHVFEHQIQNNQNDSAKVCFLSDFATPLACVQRRSNGGHILELVAAVDKQVNKFKKCHLRLIENYAILEKCMLDDSNCDIFSSILVVKSDAKQLLLFDGDFVNITIAEKQKPPIAQSKRPVICQVKVIEKFPGWTEDKSPCIFALPTIRFMLRRCCRELCLQVNVQRYHPVEESDSSCSPSWFVTPKYAKQLHIACVHSSTYNSQLAYANLLQKYFSIPRVVTRNGVIVVPTSDDVEFWQPALENNDTRKPALYFKVVQILPKSRGEHTFLADCHHTMLLLDPPVHSYVPTVMNSVFSPSQSVPPPGLEAYLQTIVSWFTPYISHSSKKRESDVLASVLVSGSSGCGKSSLVNAVAACLDMHCFQVNCHELCGETSAATEARVKNAVHRAQSLAPCILCLRNIDVLGKDRDGTGEDLRVAGSFSTLINSALSESHKYPVLVVATTSSLRAMSSDMQQVFLYNVNIDAPSETLRERMLVSLLDSAPLHHSVNTKHIAQRTAGMNLGDFNCLVAHVRRKAYCRIVKYWKETSGRDHMTVEDEKVIADSGVLLRSEDFDEALKDLQKAHSSSIGAPQIPNISWDDVGGLKNVKREILDTIQLPLEHPDLFASGLRRSGVLFYGPPGTGKTLLAKAVATECSLNFLSVKGPELINMYVGQSEENVRDVFEKARSASPCVIFFDELDSLAPNRGRSGDSGGVMDRVVSQLLAELDGISKSSDVFVIGATNRPDLLDPALLRPGRFDKLLYLGVSQDRESQLHILKALTRKFSLHEDCDLEEIVEQCPFNMTGADFYALCSDAMLNGLKTKVDLLQQGENVDQSRVEVRKEDFMGALANLVPSISVDELQRYQILQQQLTESK